MDGIRVAVIYGSTRPGRFCDTIVRWTVERVAASEKFQLDVIDPADRPAGLSIDERPSLPLQQRLGQADAFVIVTPEYNHGYPVPFKALIDSSGAEMARQSGCLCFVWRGLRRIARGGSVASGVRRAARRGDPPFRDLPSAWEQFDESGALRSPDRAPRGMETLLARLNWWAVALREARSTSPYPRLA